MLPIAGHNTLQMTWRIEDLKVLAIRFGIGHRQQGTSHVTFHHPVGVVVVPAVRPIKPACIRKFVTLIDKIAESA